ncbi:peptidoglycan DD-metalloendopeptidase family protein [Oceanobacillus sp. CF4.6]|uniref:peptidoglycan DD-metalloendopeptidase family protein n=1 Tax=Oceanobacillus sp. CF4.6 TaxID=3373080 RepID=UPI003EE5399A
MFKRKTESLTKKKSNLLGKLALTACLGLGFTMTTAYADDALGTVYHVYVDGEHVGKIDKKEVVQRVIDMKITEGEQKYENLSLAVGEDVSYISEKVFNPSFDNNKVLNRLNEELTLKANAVELKIADQTVGYFSNKDAAYPILEDYMNEYVDVELLTDIKLENDTEEVTIEGLLKSENMELSVGESVVTDVTLSEVVSLSTQKVLPDEILSGEQGITMLEKGTLEEQVHTIQEGEVLGKIASEYDLTINKLLEINPSLAEDSILKPDQKIHVMEYEPFVDVIITEEKLVKDTIGYETEVIESDEMYKGEEKVKQEGKDGIKEVLYSIEKTNGKQTDKKALDETVTKDPVKEVIIKGTKILSPTGTGDMVWPAVGGYISSHPGERWGKTHKGIDIARPSNRNILAADNGVVESAGFNSGGYGNKVVINHNNGMKSIYAHLSSIDVKVGQVLEKGSKIGVMGSTGNSTGIHLHFEVYKNGALQNPTEYVSK